MKPGPAFDERGVPWCTREDCPAYDGKRCQILGFRPGSLCEPQVAEMARLIRAAQAEAAP